MTVKIEKYEIAIDNNGKEEIFSNYAILHGKDEFLSTTSDCMFLTPGVEIKPSDRQWADKCYWEPVSQGIIGTEYDGMSPCLIKRAFWKFLPHGDPCVGSDEIYSEYIEKWVPIGYTQIHKVPPDKMVRRRIYCPNGVKPKKWVCGHGADPGDTRCVVCAAWSGTIVTTFKT